MSKKNEIKMKSWYSDRYQSVVVQRNILSLLALFAMIAVTISVIFVKQVTSSKSLEPYVIEIEEKTGVPTVVEQLSQSSFTTNTTLKRYFLYSFIKSVEGYNPATYIEDFAKARLFSSSAVYGKIRNRISSRNPNSPVSKMDKKGMIVVKLKSIQFMTPEKVQIRMRLETKGRSSGFSARRDVIAYVNFRFANINLTLEERFINPIGFQVIGYSIDDDLIRGSEENN